MAKNLLPSGFLKALLNANYIYHKSPIPDTSKHRYTDTLREAQISQFYRQSLKISKLFKGLSKFEYVGAIAGFITLKIAVILIVRYSTN
jgi:hypothetical protein